jgi:TPP-dependent pyruvate/acetoin dehydrogenase alpha subunit
MSVATIELTATAVTEILRKMYRIRHFEGKVIDLFQEGLIRGSTHTYIGEEASGVGACTALRDDDYITSTHRGHGHCIAKGGRVDLMMAELLGKATGYCKGKGGSMHIADVDVGILGANGIVGGGIGIATGAGLTCKLRGDGRVCLCFFGDGGFNQGVLYESANIAALWKLPVIYFCENNKYAMSTPIERSSAVIDLSARAAAFGRRSAPDGATAQPSSSPTPTASRATTSVTASGIARATKWSGGARAIRSCGSATRSAATASWARRRWTRSSKRSCRS